MKISKGSYKSYLFNVLDHGDFFYCGNSYYLRIQENDMGQNSVNTETGTLHRFDDDVIVNYFPNATIYLEGVEQ